MVSTADFGALLVALVDAGIDFVVVGGVAAFVQGAPIVTIDLDVVHDRSPENVRRLVALLPRIHAGVRGRPDLRPSHDALTGPGHQLLTTRYGDLDLLGAIEGERTYGDLIEHTVPVTIRGREVRAVDLETLLALKRGSERPKDRMIVAILEQVLTETRG